MKSIQLLFVVPPPLSWDGALLWYFPSSIFHLKYLNFTDNYRKVGGNVSTKLRYGTLTLEESSPDCAGYTQDQFSISNMVCALSKPALPSRKLIHF